MTTDIFSPIKTDKQIASIETPATAGNLDPQVTALIPAEKVIQRAMGKKHLDFDETRRRVEESVAGARKLLNAIHSNGELSQADRLVDAEAGQSIAAFMKGITKHGQGYVPLAVLADKDTLNTFLEQPDRREMKRDLLTIAKGAGWTTKDHKFNLEAIASSFEHLNKGEIKFSTALKEHEKNELISVNDIYTRAERRVGLNGLPPIKPDAEKISSPSQPAHYGSEQYRPKTLANKPPDSIGKASQIRQLKSAISAAPFIPTNENLGKLFGTPIYYDGHDKKKFERTGKLQMNVALGANGNEYVNKLKAEFRRLRISDEKINGIQTSDNMQGQLTGRQKVAKSDNVKVVYFPKGFFDPDTMAKITAPDANIPKATGKYAPDFQGQQGQQVNNAQSAPFGKLGKKPAPVSVPN